ncbi:hypothetical protein EV663_11661 [Rhodovulum bhavnagarense]|uniref:Uncharacterized protein n=1 Tax=Rhodovulum bhavnagarense TaxID=992286 RepID=A0A4R2RKL1_9RHOB|nr:hypothetical protein [Rhodovulum bhavnagarense]TCP59765.1 hypothetical protein EV663_11661 [Rhodovulum bhavnagarense]
MAPRHKISELTEWKQEQLIKDRLKGRSYDSIGEELGIAGNSVKRWWLQAVPEDKKLVIAAKMKKEEVQEAADIIASDGDDIDMDLRWLLRRLRKVIEEADESGEPDRILELAQMREMRQTLMDLAKVRGMFSSKIDVTVDLGTSPQFIMLRKIILRVLEQFPDAKAAFLDEMQALKVIEHQP